MLAPSLVAVLLLTSSVVSAAGGHRAGSNHRRHSSKNVAAKRVASAALDSQGRQIPGTVQMRKRANGKNCKVRPAATTSTVAVLSSSAASAEATSAADQSSVAIVQDAAVPTTSQVAAPAAQTTTTTETYVAPTTTTAQQAAPTTTTAAAAAAVTTKAVSSSSSSSAGITPNGKKAGVAGMDSLPWIKDHIGWWYDWSPQPQGDAGNAIAVPMLWGGGTADATDAARLSLFKSLTTVPTYIQGMNEPDCSAGGGSAGLTVAASAVLWNTLIGPKKAEGSILISPGMCKQAAEDFLTPFRQQISVDWDYTDVHINKNSAAGIKADLDHYASYGKPLWVSEFACVDDSTGFTPCTDQNEINAYINLIVDTLEADDRVVAYAYSDGYGLGDVWPTVKNGALSASGQTYLNAISKYH